MRDGDQMTAEVNEKVWRGLSKERTCKTCKHWDQEPYLAHWKVHRCDLLNEGGADDVDGLIAPDQGKGGIYTGPDFGCNKWEPKPAA